MSAAFFIESEKLEEEASAYLWHKEDPTHCSRVATYLFAVLIPVSKSAVLFFRDRIAERSLWWADAVIFLIS